MSAWHGVPEASRKQNSGGCRDAAGADEAAGTVEAVETVNSADRSQRLEPWRQARRVLLVRLDNLGDVLMTTPAIAAVRECLPQAHLTLLAAPALCSLAPHLPEIDDIIGFDAPWMKAGAAKLDGIEDQASDGPVRGGVERDLLNRLMAQRYDAAIIFTVCTQSVFPAATLCRLAGIPMVLGHARERAYGLLSDEVPDLDRVEAGMRHEVRRQLDLVDAVGFRTVDERLRWRVLDQDRSTLRRRLAAAGLPVDQAFVLLHPGASAPSRRYPATLLGQAAHQLLGQATAHGHERPAIVLCGGPGEELLLSEALAAFQALRATGRGGTGGTAGEGSTHVAAVGRGEAPRQEARSTGAGDAPVTVISYMPTGLGELAALIEAADVLIANNSGPVHLACAVGTPVVDIYALTNPQHTPWQVASRVLSRDVPCRNCQKSVCPQRHHACLLGVSPLEVAQAAVGLMALPPVPSPDGPSHAMTGDPELPRGQWGAPRGAFPTERAAAPVLGA